MVFRSGDYYVICDRCGFKKYKSETRLEWNGLLVCLDCWDPKHPHFIPPKSRREKQTVEISRPEPEDKFITTPITGDDL